MVSTTPTHSAAPSVNETSLRSSFAWTLAGNAVYGAGQWAMLSLFAKLGGSRMLGQYALAVAVTTPAAMLSHLNLRAVLATDMERRHPFGDYLAVRVFASGLGLAAIVAIAALQPDTWATGARDSAFTGRGADGREHQRHLLRRAAAARPYGPDRTLDDGARLAFRGAHWGRRWR